MPYNLHLENSARSVFKTGARLWFSECKFPWYSHLENSACQPLRVGARLWFSECKVMEKKLDLQISVLIFKNNGVKFCVSE